MEIQEAFYFLGTIASVLAIATCLSILFAVIRIYSMVKAAQVTLTTLARTKLAGGALTIIPLLVSAFLRRKRG